MPLDSVYSCSWLLMNLLPLIKSNQASTNAPLSFSSIRMTVLTSLLLIFSLQLLGRQSDAEVAEVIRPTRSTQCPLPWPG